MDKYRELLSKYVNNSCSQDELMILIDWIKNPDNEEELRRIIDQDWKDFSIEESTGQALSFEQLLQKIGNGFGSDRLKKDSPSNFKLLKSVTKIAAGILIPILLGVSSYYLLREVKPEGASLSINKITAPIGSKTRLELKDGTKIWLNAGSSLEISETFSGKFREVTLLGEAYFDVTKDPHRPFIVKTSDLNIRVLGTIFNVKSYPEEGTIETTLLEGSVAISRLDSKPKTKKVIYLHPNERATFIKKNGVILQSDLQIDHEKQEAASILKPRNEKIILAKNINTDEFVSWKDDKLIFRNESLESLCVKLERWYNVKINIHSNALKQYHYTGTLQNENIVQVIEAFSLTMPLTYTINHNEIDIWPKNK